MRPLLVAGLLVVSAPALAGDTQYHANTVVSQSGLQVSGLSGMKHDGKKLWVKLQLVNNSGKLVLFDRNQLKAKTPDGGTFTRIIPIIGKGSVYAVKPGDKQELTVEFASPPGQPATILVEGAWGLDQRPIELGSIVVTP